MPQVTGLERAVFGDVSADEIRAWLGRHLRSRLHMDVNDIVFTSGRVAPVYGLRLQDGSTVVLKIHRNPVNTDRLAAASRCQRLLAEAGFPCPAPLDGPAPTDGRIATIESLLDHGHPGNGHNPPVRRSLAASLAAQVDTLRGVTDSSLVIDAPAWARYQDGPWPEPHDPIFDFSTLPDSTAGSINSRERPPTCWRHSHPSPRSDTRTGRTCASPVTRRWHRSTGTASSRAPSPSSLACQPARFRRAAPMAPRRRHQTRRRLPRRLRQLMTHTLHPRRTGGSRRSRRLGAVLQRAMHSRP